MHATMTSPDRRISPDSDPGGASFLIGNTNPFPDTGSTRIRRVGIIHPWHAGRVLISREVEDAEGVVGNAPHQKEIGALGISVEVEPPRTGDGTEDIPPPADSAL